jgi:hypothetical protein
MALKKIRRNLSQGFQGPAPTGRQSAVQPQTKPRLVAQSPEQFQRQQALIEKDFLRYINHHVNVALA